MGMLTTPSTAIVASLMTWFSFSRYSPSVQPPEATAGSSGLVASGLDAGGQQVLADELQAALEERDARIRELEAVAGAPRQPLPLPEWRSSLNALAAFGPASSNAQQPLFSGEEPDDLGTCSDALGALADAHVGVAMLLCDAALDAWDWTVVQVWPWPIDSLGSLVPLENLQLTGFGDRVREWSATWVAHIDEKLPLEARHWRQLALAALSEKYVALQASIGDLAAGVAHRHPQHKATIAQRDPVHLLAQVAGFFLLCCWEVYGLWRLLRAIGRRTPCALCCKRRPQGTRPEAAIATAKALQTAAVPLCSDEAALTAMASAAPPAAQDAVLGKKGSERAARRPLQPLSGNIPDTWQCI